MPTQNKWNFAPSMEQGFWCIVAQSGRVIALRVPDEKTAKQICDEHNDSRASALQAAREVHDKYKHLDALLTDKQWLPDTFLSQIMFDAWRTIRALATPPDN